MPNSVIRQLSKGPNVYRIWGRAVEPFSSMGLHASTTVPPCGYQHSFRAHTSSFRVAQTPKLLLVSVKVELHLKISALKSPSDIDFALCSGCSQKTEDCYTKGNRVFLFLMAVPAFHFRCRCWCSFYLTKLHFSPLTHTLYFQWLLLHFLIIAQLPLVFMCLCWCIT